MLFLSLFLNSISAQLLPNFITPISSLETSFSLSSTIINYSNPISSLEPSLTLPTPTIHYSYLSTSDSSQLATKTIYVATPIYLTSDDQQEYLKVLNSDLNQLYPQGIYYKNLLKEKEGSGIGNKVIEEEKKEVKVKVNKLIVGTNLPKIDLSSQLPQFINKMQENNNNNTATTVTKK